MISVKVHNSGYKVTSSSPGSGLRGWSMEVETLKSVHLMIDHYFMKNHPRRNCPSCKNLRKEASV